MPFKLKAERPDWIFYCLSILSVLAPIHSAHGPDVVSCFCKLLSDTLDCAFELTWCNVGQVAVFEEVVGALTIDVNHGDSISCIHTIT